MQQTHLFIIDPLEKLNLALDTSLRIALAPVFTAAVSAAQERSARVERIGSTYSAGRVTGAAISYPRDCARQQLGYAAVYGGE